MNKYERILVAMDFSEPARAAMAEAIRIARRHQARLHVLYVDVIAQPVEGFEFAPLADHVHRLDQAALDAVGKEFAPSYRDTDLQARRDLSAAAGILAYARQERADLIVVGTHGRKALPEMVLGSVAQDIVLQAPVSVLVVRQRPAHRTEGIVVPIDFSSTSPGLLRHAADCAREAGEPLTVVHAVDAARLPHGTPRQTQERRARVRLDQYVQAYVTDPERPLATRTVLATGHAEDAIVTVAEECEARLIIIAPSSHGALDRLLLGSVTKRVIRSAPCPVLVWRESGAARVAVADERAVA